MKNQKRNQKRESMSKHDLGRSTVYLVATLCLLLGLPNAGETSPITVAITGTVRSVDDFPGVLGGAINPGDTITGFYTYDSATPDSNSLETVGDYWHTTAPFGISLTVAGLTFQTDPNNVSFLVEIVNDHAPGIPPTDNYVLHSYNNLFAVSVPDELGPGPMNVISWQLDDPTALALSSTDLPTTPPVLSDWQSLFGLDIMSTGDGFFLIRSDITSAVLVEVDSDSDGVPDDKDQCPNTPAGAIVDAHGCSIDQLVPCAGPASGGAWASHGQYVSAVGDAAGVFLEAGLITEEQKAAIVAKGGQSNCGRQ